MKKRILLFSAVTSIVFLTLSSFEGGPANPAEGGSRINRTGAKGTAVTCGGSGCHSGTGSATAVTITVDSGSTSVSNYVPGHTYTVKIHGTNSSGLLHFGFQFAVVSGTGGSQVQAGTSSGFATGVQADVFSSLSLVEHNTPLAATSAGVYDQSFTWTAPSPGVGTVTMYCTLNAVNGDGDADAPDVSNNTSITLGQETSTAVATVTNNIGINAFPNPTTNTLHLQTANAGTYAVAVYDMAGRVVSNENITVNGTASINTANWATGFYNVAVSKDGNTQVIPVVKQ